MSLPKFLLKEAIVAPEGFNRWRVPPASIAIHLCIGSVYAWSNFSPALIRELGVAGSAADDWSLTSVTWIFSVAIVFLGSRQPLLASGSNASAHAASALLRRSSGVVGF